MARKGRAQMTKKKVKVRPVRVKPQEVTLLGKALRSLGGLGGGALGGIFGQAGVGSNVGTSLGATISKWLGAGDYTVRQNSIVSSTQRGSNSIPAMHNVGQSITIRHKEYVAQIKGSVGFNVQRFFLLQPGDTNTFPWLSGVADRFQQYRIKGMVFHYVPTSGYAVSGSNPALGAVMMQTSYRANDADPASKVEMMNEYWASESVPSDSFCHPIECSPQENPFQVHYVRSLPVPSGDSPLLYDIGKTYVATQGMPADGNIVGDLWVTYEIELMKPQIQSSVAVDTRSGFADSSGAVVPGVSPLGTTQVMALGSLPFTMVNRTITFPIGILGRYLITARMVASTTFSSFDWSGSSTYINCSASPVDNSGLSYTRTVLSAGSGALGSGYMHIAVSITDPSSVASLVLPAGTATGSANNTTVSIVEM